MARPGSTVRFGRWSLWHLALDARTIVGRLLHIAALVRPKRNAGEQQHDEAEAEPGCAGEAAPFGFLWKFAPRIRVVHIRHDWFLRFPGNNAKGPACVPMQKCKAPVIGDRGGARPYHVKLGQRRR